MIKASLQKICINVIFLEEKKDNCVLPTVSKPLFNFSKAENELLLEAGENFIKHRKQKLHSPEVYEGVDAEVISVRRNFLVRSFLPQFGEGERVMLSSFNK